MTYVPIDVRLDFDALAPEFSRAVNDLDEAASAEAKRAGLDSVLRDIVKLRASQLNGCAYCVDMHARDLRRAGVTSQRVDAVAIWRDSNLFTAAERVALELTEQATRLSETHVSAESVAAATQEFGEEGAAALVSSIIAINVWNLIGVTTRCWPTVIRNV